MCEWTNEAEKAFTYLRDKLAKEPVVLVFPDWSKIFYVEADASLT